MSMAIANRYARALADVVASTGDYRRTLRELADFSAAYRESAELREVFETPAVPLLKKLKVLDLILRRLETSLITGNFLRVLATNYRMAVLPEFYDAFRKIANERLGVARVEVLFATELGPAQQEALRARFVELTQREVEFQFLLDRELLGGVRAQVDSTVYDGSVRGELERIRRQLTAH
jgi:F-type H+-transporting ATPase subunit delta